MTRRLISKSMVRTGCMKPFRGLCAVEAIVVCAAFRLGAAESDARYRWGSREAHPAVVNPPVEASSARVLSLCGEWEFATGNQLLRQNSFEPLRFSETKPWPKLIVVPGCWESQAVVGHPGASQCWDVLADNSLKPIRHEFMGVGYYRRSVTVPADWKGLRIWLKVGGVKAQGRFYVNGKPVAAVDDYCGTYKYDITDLVEPGKPAQVAAQVSNLCPSRKGLMSNHHRWGGIYRAVELEATPPTFIDDAWIRGDFDRRTAEAHVEIGGDVEKWIDGKVRVTVEGETVETQLKHSNTQTIAEVPLRAFRPWSPEHPNLYTGLIELVSNGTVIQSRTERFGVRKLEVRGKEFYLNDRPFFVRGFGDDHVYPMSGLTPADREQHRSHLARAHRAGFNFVRLHTHCEVPEYFDAADELGILVQPELPYYNDQPTEGFEFDPKRDVTELWRNFRRHPSFAVYSMGNEGTFGAELDAEMHRYVKAMDPDRLKINQDCHIPEINPLESADFVGGPIKIWQRGSFNPDRPFVTHEYMNLGVKSDSRLEPKFTGAWLPPVPRRDRAAWLSRFGLTHAWGDLLQDAQHVLQSVYQKRGIECARTDPYCDGYCYWTIVDVVVRYDETYSAQGLFNPFWETKSRGLTPDDVSRFNSASCVLLSDVEANRVFTAGETYATDVLFAHYADAPMKAARLEWALLADGRTLKSDSLPVGDLPLGPVRKVASLRLVTPAVDRPCKAKLWLSVADAAFATTNDWDVWLFPSRPCADGSRIAVTDALRKRLSGRYAHLLPIASAAEADLVIAEVNGPEIEEALARGQAVISLGGMDGPANVSLGWWSMGPQVGTAFRQHAALGALPHERALTPLLFRILKAGRSLPLRGLDEKDMLVVGEGGGACYVYLAQAKVGKGRLILSHGLDLASDTPEGTAILDGLIAYARSSAFAPESTIDLGRLTGLSGR